MYKIIDVSESTRVYELSSYFNKGLNEESIDFFDTVLIVNTRYFDDFFDGDTIVAVGVMGADEEVDLTRGTQVLKRFTKEEIGDSLIIEFDEFILNEIFYTNDVFEPVDIEADLLNMSDRILEDILDIISDEDEDADEGVTLANFLARKDWTPNSDSVDNYDSHIGYTEIEFEREEVGSSIISEMQEMVEQFVAAEEEDGTNSFADAIMDVFGAADANAAEDKECECATESRYGVCTLPDINIEPDDEIERSSNVPELKTGMMVRIQEGYVCKIGLNTQFGDLLMYKHGGWDDLSSIYNDHDLGYEPVEVYEPTQQSSLGSWDLEEDYKLIWINDSTKEMSLSDIEEALGHKIKLKQED